jgi:hypothetical protein
MDSSLNEKLASVPLSFIAYAYSLRNDAACGTFALALGRNILIVIAHRAT